ncbi:MULTISPECIES: ABC transporter permease [Micromonospora]|uniref:Dipeptide transport system permease protein DppB n=3 Tax=Micromonospora TaxID=1873 RepID=A0A328NCK2_9ACTN|nr:MULTISPECIES: ABC transporter permease [Micromonospora]KAB1915797.1 ABC transporter permease [Micromonospora noduli]MCG5462223.1 ABC transporter permease [Micromonospora alfalfae]RAN95944.1 Dipeptide transport system permease protein DppB [Micromonospora saelicesensis]RAN99345.1 Dipeptide transport system permease protein DppB [Micromonospora noduli]RAO02871.1 Dipeptide transport system permease protein DppB [Micromonospora noduli]
MGRYLLRRLLQLVPVFIGTTFLIYWLVWAVPGDPFAGKCGERRCPDQYIAFMTEKYHLDQNVFVQYANYMKNLLQGDFGQTFSQREISDIILTSYPNTLKLALVALAIEAIIGLGAGVLSGLRRNGFLDNLVLVSTLFLIALPVFVVGFVLQWLLGVQWGIIKPTVSSEMRWSELIVPGFVLGSASVAYIARVARTSIAENRRADYVRTAIAKGLPMRRVVGVHLLRNSLIPVVTLLGTDLGALMGGAIVTEGIFGINGIGRQVFRAIITKESATVVGIVVVLVLVYLVMNLLVDLLYAALDPRIRYE